MEKVPLQRLWDIEGYPNYFFADDNELYRVTVRGELRRSMKRYKMGYLLKSRFYSLSQLHIMLRRHVVTA